jgi:hypothetical protein
MWCLVTHTMPADEAERWLDSAGKLGNDFRAPDLAKCNLQTARICAQAQCLFDNEIQDDMWILGLLRVVKNALVIDLQYQNWEDSATGSWCYKELHMSLSTASDTSSHFSGSEGQKALHIYHDIWVAWIWNNFRSFRIHLHEVLLHCISLLDCECTQALATALLTIHTAHPSAQKLAIDTLTTRNESSEVISTMISDICSSVPFCIGDIDSTGKPLMPTKSLPLGGYLLMLPLYIVSSSSDPGGVVDTWVHERLQYISKVMGIHRAARLASRVMKEPWLLS